MSPVASTTSSSPANDLETRRIEFWSLFVSISSGQRIMYLDTNPSRARIPSTNDAPTSCKKHTDNVSSSSSASSAGDNKHFSKTSSVRSALHLTNESTNSARIFCHPSNDPAALVATRTNAASNAHRYNACKGIDASSSSSLVAGYLALLIGINLSNIVVSVPSIPFTRLSNTYSNHCSNHSSSFAISTSYRLITVGRVVVPVAVDAVFVTLSGIEHKRFAPISASLKKSDTRYERVRFS